MQDQIIVESAPASAQPTPVPWQGRELGIAFALSVLLYLGGSLLGALLIGWLGLGEGPHLGLVLALVQLAMLVPPLVVMARYGDIAATLGLDHFGWRALFETIVSVLLGFGASIVWGSFLYLFGQRAQEPLVPLFGTDFGSFAVLFVVGGILAPIVEEVVFRGFLFNGLRRVLAPTPAILLSGILFGALHFQLLAFPALFMLGVLLARLYHRTRSLWAPILMHFCINAIGLIAQYVAAQQGLI